MRTPMTKTVFCSECDGAIEATLERGEFEDWWELDDNCPHCGESTENVVTGKSGPDSGREDFHADC
jgi:hypothetical protein